MAKVVRDRMITNGKFSEMPLNRRKHTMKFGSGYPSDPICKEWIHNDGMIDPIFTFPNIVRFSWAPIKKILLQKPSSEQSGDTTGTPPTVVPIVFAADTNNEEDDNDSETQNYDWYETSTGANEYLFRQKQGFKRRIDAVSKAITIFRP